MLTWLKLLRKNYHLSKDGKTSVIFLPTMCNCNLIMRTNSDKSKLRGETFYIIRAYHLQVSKLYKKKEEIKSQESFYSEGD